VNYSRYLVSTFIQIQHIDIFFTIYYVPLFFREFFYGKLDRVIYFDIDLISVDKLMETSTKHGAHVIVWKIVMRLL